MPEPESAALARISAHVAAERFAEAVEECEGQLHRGVESAALHALRATALQAIGEYHEAVDAWSRAICLNPQREQFACALGELFVSAFGDYATAETWFLRALAVDQTCRRAYLGIAGCRIREWRFPERFLDVFVGLPAGARVGLLLEATVVQLCNHGRYGEARPIAEHLVELRDDTLYGHLTLARIADEGEHDRTLARTRLETAATALDDKPLYHLACVMRLIKIGEWAEAAVRARDLVRRFGKTFPGFDVDAPQWDGSPVAGKTVLLDAQLAHGYGDSILFCRFAKDLRDLGAKVGFRARRGLEALVADVAGVDFVIPRDEPVPSVDYVCEMSFAWMLLGLSMADVGRHMPYLHPTVAGGAEWRARLGPPTALRVGIAWRTTDLRAENPYTSRSIPLPALAPLARLDGVELVSLHHVAAEAALAAAIGPGTVTEFASALRGLGPTADLIAQLDVVVTADTVFAHLAGALGKPAFVLLPYSADSRWMIGRSETPWYPTVRLVRQPAPGQWAPAVDACADALAEMVRASQWAIVAPSDVPGDAAARAAARASL